ncbi:hypothetical protein GLOTRDRAFT_96482 [Gloeophyllum trabeum ATCC 11539]|uniref:Uncharacterized protein n=1 Tax=Gloeophyllum trabeum (strain ATCC 11539 / FP-39264 / Madison 617) TaxID=670483 RepID=S7PV10_GLOTA|nr:uncharacterized protein GLOTRDRAFT_96482 [Gloeophyllum trabeum ATCC 11539]EPQ51308.1 hypothetical protein GLOTRDRAFT_96482 [Gloeophyllum trabeum ATCC 11539]
MYRATVEQQLREEQKEKEELLAVVHAEQDRMRREQEAWNEQLADGQRRMHAMMNFIKAREAAEKAAAERMQAMQAALAEAEEQRQHELAEAEARHAGSAKRQTELAQLMSKIGGSIHTPASHPEGEPTGTMGPNQRAMSSPPTSSRAYRLTDQELQSLRCNGRKKNAWQTLHALNMDPDPTGPQPPITASPPAPEALEEALDEVLEQFAPGSLGTGYRPISRETRRKQPNVANECKEEYTKLKERNPEVHKDYLDLCRETVRKALDIKMDSDIAMKPRADTIAVEAYNDGGPDGPDRDNLCIDMGAAVKDSQWNQRLVEILVERAHILCDQRLARGYSMEAHADWIDHLRGEWWSVQPKYGRDGTVEDQDELCGRLQTKYSGTHKKAGAHPAPWDQTITIKSERGELDTLFWTYLRSIIVWYGEDGMSSDDTDEETDGFRVRKMSWRRDIERELKIVDDQRDADGIKDNCGSKPAPRSRGEPCGTTQRQPPVRLPSSFYDSQWLNDPQHGVLRRDRSLGIAEQLDCLHIHACNVRVTALERAIELQDKYATSRRALRICVPHLQWWPPTLLWDADFIDIG